MEQSKQLTPLQRHKQFMEQPSVKARLEEILKNNAPQFIASVLQVVSSNSYLQNADPKTVYTAAMTAAVLNLPINNNLGYAWIVPYKGQAQFQMGYKGFVQLAQRTGQYRRINAVAVHENQFKSFDLLYEDLQADFSVAGEGKIVGYVAYFSLINGFEKVLYMTREQVEAHAKRFSQSFNSKTSPWQTDFDAMAKKTVLKKILSTYGPMSIEMQMAVKADQSVVHEVSDQSVDVDYVDYTDSATSDVIAEAKEDMRESGQTKIDMP